MDDAGVDSLSGYSEKMQTIMRRIKEQYRKNLADAGNSSVVHLRSDVPNGGLTNIIIHPSSKRPGKWQMTWLDANMVAFGDSQFASFENALKSASGIHAEGPPMGHGGYSVVEKSGKR